MAGLNKLCSSKVQPKNTGVDCEGKMVAPALVFLVPQNDKWTEEDEADFIGLIQEKLHEVPSKRWYPLFGNYAPIRTINDNKDSDKTVSYDDGSSSFIENGMITRTFLTNKGGENNAKAYMSFNAIGGFAFVVVDKLNTVKRRLNADGTRSGMLLNMKYAVTPDEATFTTEFLYGFALNYSVEEYYKKSIIDRCDEDLLDTNGLIDTKVKAGATPATTTKLYLSVLTVGSETDLVSKYPALASVTAFKVYNVTDSAAVVPSAAAVVNGQIELTMAAQTAADVMKVELALPSVLLGLNVPGYEGVETASITIP